jgi:hypothetical protein
LEGDHKVVEEAEVTVTDLVTTVTDSSAAIAIVIDRALMIVGHMMIDLDEATVMIMTMIAEVVAVVVVEEVEAVVEVTVHLVEAGVV